MFLFKYKVSSVMSVNFSQNPEYYKSQGNFNGKYTPEAPQQFSMLKNMGLPSTGEEAIKFAPFAAGGILFSKLVSAFGTVITRLIEMKLMNPMTLNEIIDIKTNFNIIDGISFNHQ